MALRPSWAAQGRTGPVRKFLELSVFACEGAVVLIDEREGAEGDCSIVSVADMRERIEALAGCPRTIYDDHHGFSNDGPEASRRAFVDADPFADAVERALREVSVLQQNVARRLSAARSAGIGGRWRIRRTAQLLRDAAAHLCVVATDIDPHTPVAATAEDMSRSHFGYRDPAGIFRFTVLADDKNAANFIACIEQVLGRRLSGVDVLKIDSEELAIAEEMESLKKISPRDYIVTQDAVCGACGRTLEQHDEGRYCNRATDDEFDESVPIEHILDEVKKINPLLFSNIVDAWRLAHGYELCDGE